MPFHALPGSLLLGLIGLSVVPGEVVRYRCGGGQTIEAHYGSLSDQSLAFVPPLPLRVRALEYRCTLQRR